MKVTSPRIIVIQEDGQKPIRFTDAAKAAEHWARIKEVEWVEKHKDDVIYKISTGPGIYHRKTVSNLLYDDGRVHYRKFKRRALAVFRKIMGINS